MTQLAYPLLMLMLTGSPAAAGALAAARALPSLVLGPPVGALADRGNRPRTMVPCDLIPAVNMATVPLALLLGGSRDVPAGDTRNLHAEIAAGIRWLWHKQVCVSMP